MPDIDGGILFLEDVAEHPYRERLRSYFMTALYRSGRQADALDAYQDARRALVDGLGIEPSPPLQELERAILRQDTALDLRAPATAREIGERSILVAIRDEARVEALLEVAPLLVLYELSIWLSVVMERRWERSAAEAEAL